MLHTPLDFLLSAALIGATLPAAMQAPAASVAALLRHFGLSVPYTPSRFHAGFAAAIALCWGANQLMRAARLRSSPIFEMRASYNLIRGDGLWWVAALAFFSAAVTPLFLSAPLPLLAVLAAVASVMLGRYLFFVSVVPLTMGLTFLKGKSAHGAHA
jgi:DMSO reductase anchor subunit